MSALYSATLFKEVSADILKLLLNLPADPVHIALGPVWTCAVDLK